jgi:hypothetical protein
MEAAFLAGRTPGFNDRFGYAAEIRALADWLVPEEPMGDVLQVSTIMRDERQRLRQVLLAEAKRAEVDQ